jgi:hypothetical protein
MARSVDECAASGGHYRQPPWDEDWTRRYLRKRNIKCEGDNLQTALEGLSEEAWKRMKAAFRKRESVRGRMDYFTSLAFKKELGFLWRRVIAMGLVAEEDAKIICQTQEVGSDPDCRFFFIHLTHAAAMQCVAQKEEAFKQAAQMVYALRKMHSERGKPPPTVEDVMTFLQEMDKSVTREDVEKAISYYKTS